MLNGKKHFNFFANCIPVKGASRSIICDLHKHRLDIIPNSLLDILEEHKGKTIEAIKILYGKENESVIEEYFQYLIDKDYIFLCDESDLDFFPELDLNWEIPSLIENAIIDYDGTNLHNYSAIFQQLETLGCIALHLRFFTKINIFDLEEIISLTQESRFESIDLLVPYSTKLTENQLQQWAEKHPRLRSIVIHQSPEELPFDFKHNYLTVIWTTRKIDTQQHCGTIGPKHFSVNQKLFSESQHFNTCLNHKISIDTKGDIRNCPSMVKQFGNVADTMLSTALEAEGFKQYWTINKNQIKTCKVCEFRHICTDCRAYLETPEDIYSKPLKCGYDPKTTDWQEWSTHPLKEKAIKYYQFEELVYSRSLTL